MRHDRFLHEHGIKIAVALVLTFVSGLVDIVGYVGVFHFFTAHLTGTTVQLGHGLAMRNWIDVYTAATILGGFVAGSLIGRTLLGIGSRSNFRKIASITIGFEAVLLGLTVFEKSRRGDDPRLELALLAAAMGLQTATLTGVGPLTVHTTFVTGMVNKLMQLVARIAFAAFDTRRPKKSGGQVRDTKNQDVAMAIFLLGIWIFYIAGAVVGTRSFDSWGMQSLFIAVGLLLLVLITDQVHPFAIQEEQEQSEH